MEKMTGSIAGYVSIWRAMLTQLEKAFIETLMGGARMQRAHGSARAACDRGIRICPAGKA